MTHNLEAQNLPFLGFEGPHGTRQHQQDPLQEPLNRSQAVQRELKLTHPSNLE